MLAGMRICTPSYSPEQEHGFPGGSGVKNSPANGGDTGSTRDPGGSHVLRSDWAHAPQVPSGCLGAEEPRSRSGRSRQPGAPLPRGVPPPGARQPGPAGSHRPERAAWSPAALRGPTAGRTRSLRAAGGNKGPAQAAIKRSSELKDNNTDSRLSSLTA